MTVLLVAAAVAFVVQLQRAWQFTVDDAYIVFRYAQNLAAGAGPTLNAGLPPVEGVSQVLWMAWLVLPHWLGIDVVAFAKVSGVALTIATWWAMAVLVLRAVRAAGGEAWAGRLGAAAAIAALAALPATAIHAVAGLCTPSFTCVLLWLFCACAGYLQAPGRRAAFAIAVLSLLAGLARPEGNLAAMVAIATVLWSAAPPARRQLLRTVLTCYLLPGAGYFLLRWWYYGLPLPLPVYVKMNDPAAFAAAAPGLPVALDLWWQFGWVVVAAAALGGLGRWLPSRPALVAGAVLLLSAVLPSHIMGYCWRYLYPALPVFLVAAGIGIARLAGGRGGKASVIRPAAATAAAVVMIVVAAGAGTAEADHFRITYARGLAAAHRELGAFLAGLPPVAEPRVLAIGDAGAVPYLSGWRTADTFGLNDPVIARSGRHDSGAVLQQRPSVLVAISRSAWHFVPWLPWETELVAAAQADGMVRAKVLWFADEYHLWVFVRPGPVAIAMSEWQPAAGVPDPFGRDAAPTGSAAQLQPLGLRYPPLELVEALVWRDRVAVRVRGAWDPALHRIVVEHGAVAPEAATADFGADPRLVGRSAGDLVHTLVLPRVLAPGQRLRIGVIAATAPYGRIAAADGRSAAELVVR